MLHLLLVAVDTVDDPPNLNSILIALVGGIALVLNGYLIYKGGRRDGKLDEIHVLVNGRLSETIETLGQARELISESRLSGEPVPPAVAGPSDAVP